MLSDLIDSLTTSISPSHRALGYLDEALDMRRRAERNRAAWQPHLDRTRRFVLSAAEQCTGRQKVVVLGSGLLLDVPVAELSASFENVVLKDVVCLPEIRKRITQYQNVTFVEHDVTGLAGRLYRVGREDLPSLPAVPVRDPGEDRDADMVISLNILSQLWVVPRAFIGRRLRRFSAEEVDEWCSRIVASHYRYLRSLPHDVCLVGDFEAVKRDPAGRIVSRPSTVHGLELPGPDERWTWNIAPLSRKNPHTSKELIVGAWRFTS
jgi:hypothetical protein